MTYRKSSTEGRTTPVISVFLTRFEGVTGVSFANRSGKDAGERRAQVEDGEGWEFHFGSLLDLRFLVEVAAFVKRLKW